MPTRRCPLLIAIDEATDWRATGQMFRDASAGLPLVILAPNIAVHSIDTLVEWIRQVSVECGGGSYFVYGRGDAAPRALSLVMREWSATVALALASPSAPLSPPLDEPRVAGNHVAVRAMFDDQDPSLDRRLHEWRETDVALRRAGFTNLDVAVADAAAASRFVDQTLRFFADASGGLS